MTSGSMGQVKRARSPLRLGPPAEWGRRCGRGWGERRVSGNYHQANHQLGPTVPVPAFPGWSALSNHLSALINTDRSPSLVSISEDQWFIHPLCRKAHSLRYPRRISSWCAHSVSRRLKSAQGCFVVDRDSTCGVYGSWDRLLAFLPGGGQQNAVFGRTAVLDVGEQLVPNPSRKPGNYGFMTY